MRGGWRAIGWDCCQPNFVPWSEAEAYRVQDALHGLLESGGFGSPAGHKIGCTTPVMQSFLGIRNPCAGAVFDSTVREGSGSFDFDRLLHPGVECEMAVRLGADLPPDDAPYDRSTVAPAVSAVMAAIELVDDRWHDYKSVDTPTLIADDFFGAGCVLGPPVTDWRGLDLTAVEGSMYINGECVGSGSGADIMGHPFEALAWLANSMAGRGRGLRWPASSCCWAAWWRRSGSSAATSSPSISRGWGPQAPSSDPAFCTTSLSSDGERFSP